MTGCGSTQRGWALALGLALLVAFAVPPAGAQGTSSGQTSLSPVSAAPPSAAEREAELKAAWYEFGLSSN